MAAVDLFSTVQTVKLVCSAFESGLMHTFDALSSVQHPLAQEGEARAAEHLALERLEDGERDAALGDLDVIEAQTFKMGQEAGGIEVHERTPWVGRQTARAVSPHTLPLTPKHQMCA